MVVVALDGKPLGPADQVPESHGSVLAAGGEGPAIRVKSEGPDCSLVAPKDVDESSLLEVPESDCAIEAGGSRVSVGMETPRKDAALVAFERLN